MTASRASTDVRGCLTASGDSRTATKASNRQRTRRGAAMMLTLAVAVAIGTVVIPRTSAYGDDVEMARVAFRIGDRPAASIGSLG
jgi:hypothetical protein